MTLSMIADDECARAKAVLVYRGERSKLEQKVWLIRKMTLDCRVRLPRHLMIVVLSQPRKLHASHVALYSQQASTQGAPQDLLSDGHDFTNNTRNFTLASICLFLITARDAIGLRVDGEGRVPTGALFATRKE